MSPWDIPVFRSAFFPKRVHRTLFSKTHDLQVRFAHPPNCAPKPSFRRFRCSAWLIQLRQRTALSPLKRSCFSRFAASEPRTVLSSLCAFLQNAQPPGSLRSPSVSAPKPSFRRFRCSAWLILQFRTEPALQAVPVFRSAYSASRNARPPAASRPPSKHTVLFLPKRSCFRFASLTLRLRTETFFQKVPVFRMAYFAIPHHRPYGRWCFARLIRQAETHDLQPLRGLHRSALRCLL